MLALMSREDALRLAVVGPVARGSGVDMDIRKDSAILCLPTNPLQRNRLQHRRHWARMNVRLDEVEESINIIDYVLTTLPSGPIKVDLPRSSSRRRSRMHLEAPRGELFYYVRSNGTDMPERVKIRTPTFANIPSFLKTAIGESIADVPSNFVSLDPVSHALTGDR
jgi:Ni,Fe-hydrogenase III large subunit